MTDAPAIHRPTGDRPAGERPVAVGVDLGGTNLRMAVVAASGAVLERHRAPGPTDAEAFVDEVAAKHAELGPGLPLGVGIASIVRGNRVAVHGPNIAVGTVDLVDAFGARGIDRVVVENDANAATYAEWRLGAAAGHDNALLVTIGTGVGGGAIVDGRLLRGASGFAGEAGHASLEVGGRRCACGRRGCLEAYAAGSAIAVTAAERLADGEASVLADLESIDGEAVWAAAVDGDALAIGVLEQTGRWLGTGLVGLINFLDPSVVVVGGGAADAVAPWLLPAARAVIEAEIEGAAHRVPPELVPATLGDDAGLVGAALLAMDVAAQEQPEGGRDDG